MTQNNKRDWSEVVKKLIDVADRCTTETFYYETFRENAIRILQEADETHKPMLRYNGELEFIPGEMYEDRAGDVYTFVGINPNGHDNNRLIFSDLRDGETITRCPGGRYYDGGESHGDIIRKHTPAPKKHKVELWLNIFSDGSCNAYQTKVDAVVDQERIACLHFEREFVEGDGL